MHPNEELIRKFYNSFQQLDHEGMSSCYDADIRFSDPVFPYLKKEEVPAMWGMLIDSLKKGKGNWEVSVSNIIVNDVEGSCRWEAKYIFSLTGNKVTNNVMAKFQFRDGKIVEHSDYFNFYKWSRMAFGLKGILLGWTKMFSSKVQQNVEARLRNWMEQ